VKIATLLKAIYRFNAISIKISMSFFADRKVNPKINLEVKKTPRYHKS
jgi:hypothetical protein